MKKTLLLILSIIITGFLFAQDCEDLFFSEYVEGSNTNKSLEIYNPTDATISLDDYQMSRYSNTKHGPQYRGKRKEKNLRSG